LIEINTCAADDRHALREATEALMSRYPVAAATSQPFAYVSRKARIDEMPKVMAESFGALSAAFAKAHADFAGPPLAHYTDYDAQTASFDVGFPARSDQLEELRSAGLSIGETASGTVMTARHIGPYDTVAKTYDAMQAQMKADGLEGSHDMWELYMSPPETPPEQIMTDVIWPVHRTPAVG
jgi:AraC family transcriptional regulator